MFQINPACSVLQICRVNPHGISPPLWCRCKFLNWWHPLVLWSTKQVSKYGVYAGVLNHWVTLHTDILNLGVATPLQTLILTLPLSPVWSKFVFQGTCMSQPASQLNSRETPIWKTFWWKKPWQVSRVAILVTGSQGCRLCWMTPITHRISSRQTGLVLTKLPDKNSPISPDSWLLSHGQHLCDVQMGCCFFSLGERLSVWSLGERQPAICYLFRKVTWKVNVLKTFCLAFLHYLATVRWRVTL